MVVHTPLRTPSCLWMHSELFMPVMTIYDFSHKYTHPVLTPYTFPPTHSNLTTSILLPPPITTSHSPTPHLTAHTFKLAPKLPTPLWQPTRILSTDNHVNYGTSNDNAPKFVASATTTLSSFHDILMVLVLRQTLQLWFYMIIYGWTVVQHLLPCIVSEQEMSGTYNWYEPPPINYKWWCTYYILWVYRFTSTCNWLASPFPSLFCYCINFFFW